MRNPEVTAVMGGQWGDEGKGKIIDLLAQKSDVVIRAHGGNNAGHTVINEYGKVALHLVPAGIFNPDTLNIIASGVALNFTSLLDELEKVEQLGVSTDNLIISPRAHLTFDHHKFRDKRRESLKGKNRLGTTGQGIGPTYTDKAERSSLRAELLDDPERLLRELGPVLNEKYKAIRVNSPRPDEFKVEFYEDRVKEASRALKDKIVDTEAVVGSHLRNGSKILIEGAHGFLLDLDYGTYPFVVSSNVSIASLLHYSGIPPIYLTDAIGIFKAYQTRVGEEPMPTELKDETGDKLREVGNEYGATTGRPRRTGWFDGVAAGHADLINGFTKLAITKLDTLDKFSPKFCYAYRLDGELIKNVPSKNDDLAKCEPLYAGFGEFNLSLEPGMELIDLPYNVRNYLKMIRSRFTKADIWALGIGPERNSIIFNN